MEIKRLREHDVSMAQTILKNFGENTGRDAVLPSFHHLSAFLSNKACYLIAALDNNVMLGFTLAYRFPSFYAEENTAYLYDIEVLPAHRKKGIGRLLIRHLLKELKKDGVSEIWLGTGVDNIPAQRLFSATSAQQEAETFYEYFYYLQ